MDQDFYTRDANWIGNLLTGKNETWPVVSEDYDTQFAYATMRLAGESHNMAEMLACRAFPSLRTDSVFNANRCNGNQFESMPQVGDYYKQVAEEAGVNITGKTYMNQLANFPGDPRVWVDSRGDVERICLERGFSCSGDVNVRSGPRPPSADIAYAPDLLRDEVDGLMEEQPDMIRADVEERIMALRTGAVDNHPLLVTDDHSGMLSVGSD